MTINVPSWGSDVPVSMPAPPRPDQPGIVDVGDGFMMTFGGIAPAIDLATFEEYRVPTYAPTLPNPDDEGRQH